MEEAVKKDAKGAAQKEAKEVKDIKESRDAKETSVPENIKTFRANMEKARTSPADKVEAQKKKGKFTARERLQYLLDENSFFEIRTLAKSRCTDFGIAEKDLKATA